MPPGMDVLRDKKPGGRDGQDVAEASPSNIDPGAGTRHIFLEPVTLAPWTANLGDAPSPRGIGHSESTKAHGLVRVGGHSRKGWPSAFGGRKERGAGCPWEHTPRHRGEGHAPSYEPSRMPNRLSLGFVELQFRSRRERRICVKKRRQRDHPRPAAQSSPRVDSSPVFRTGRT